jgi:hypothetical protein
VFANCGFDRETPTGGPEIMIPQNGVSFVTFDGGRDLKMAPTMNAMLRVDEVKDDRRHVSIANAPYPRSAAAKASALTSLKAGTLRLFRITANTHVAWAPRLRLLIQ